MATKIYFDLDGTLSDLYAHPRWLELLRAYDPEPYAVAQPMCDLDKLCAILAAKGYEIGVISWRSKCENDEYKRAVTRAKREWLKKYMPSVKEIHVVRYGTPKWSIVAPGERANCVLVDDEQKNLDDWKAHGGIAVSAEKFRAVLEVA